LVLGEFSLATEKNFNSMSILQKATKWISEKTGSTPVTVDHEFEMLWQKQESLFLTTKTTIKHVNQTIENIHGTT
jgi:hypothetical protein